MITVQNLSFTYGKRMIFQDLNLSLADGEILAVMGASGSGKSTLLNLLAGLLNPTSGEIIGVPQKIGYVFQDPRLFPWLTVAGNLRAVVNREVSDEEITQYLEKVLLKEERKSFPSELSGGMQMRVSIARAMLSHADFYLLDEPFSALDDTMRTQIASTFRAFLKDNRIPAVIVTHSHEEAETFADRRIML